jgi:hypothetical protein
VGSQCVSWDTNPRWSEQGLPHHWRMYSVHLNVRFLYFKRNNSYREKWLRLFQGLQETNITLQHKIMISLF